MNNELIKDILKGIILVSLVVATRWIDLYVLTGITEILWLVCGYLACWIWGKED